MSINHRFNKTRQVPVSVTANTPANYAHIHGGYSVVKKDWAGLLVTATVIVAVSSTIIAVLYTGLALYETISLLRL